MFTVLELICFKRLCLPGFLGNFPGTFSRLNVQHMYMGLVVAIIDTCSKVTGIGNFLRASCYRKRVITLFRGHF